MKNIPADNYFSIAGYSHIADALKNQIVLARLRDGLTSLAAEVLLFANNPDEVKTKIYDYLVDRGYVLAMLEDKHVAVLTDVGRDVVQSYVKFRIYDNTLDLVVVGDKDEVPQVEAWVKEQFVIPGIVTYTATGINQFGSLISERKFLPLTDMQLAKSSFYPAINIPLADYYKAFMESDESILVLYGPAGTGKSTFLRSLIASGEYVAYLAYNKEVVTSSKLISCFFSNPEAAILAYEDMDVHLANREDGNELMSTLLNAAEGIVKHKKKKIVFSTNLPSIDRIDPALLREGRCFDILHFDLLKVAEAQAVMQDMHISHLDLSGKDRWSLAEVLAKRSVAQQTTNRFKTRAGFV